MSKKIKQINVAHLMKQNIELKRKNQILTKWMRRIYKNINGKNDDMSSEFMAEVALQQIKLTPATKEK